MFDTLGESSNAPHRSRRYLNKDDEAANKRLVHNYFFIIVCTMKMHSNVVTIWVQIYFMCIVNDLNDNYESFQFRWDDRGRQSLLPYKVYHDTPTFGIRYGVGHSR